MRTAAPLPRFPYVLLAALTIVSFGGPFVIVAFIRGGEKPGWPPDRPIEWIAVTIIMTLFLILFIACVSIRMWYRERSSQFFRK